MKEYVAKAHITLSPSGLHLAPGDKVDAAKLGASEADLLAQGAIGSVVPPVSHGGEAAGGSPPLASPAPSLKKG